MTLATMSLLEDVQRLDLMKEMYISNAANTAMYTGLEIGLLTQRQ